MTEMREAILDRVMQILNVSLDADRQASRMSLGFKPDREKVREMLGPEFAALSKGMRSEDVPSVASHDAPQESASSGEGGRDVAPPNWEDLSPETQSDLRNVYHGPHDHTRSLYEAFRQVLRKGANGWGSA